jgi:hypothetical protein
MDLSNCTGQVASNERRWFRSVNSEGVEWRWSWLISMRYLSIHLKIPRKSTGNVIRITGATAEIPTRHVTSNKWKPCTSLLHC